MENKQKLTSETLRDFPLFSELTIDQLRQISLISKVQNFKKNEMLFSEGDDYKGFFILLKGSVKVYKISSEGKESILHLIKPLDAFGDVPLFEGGNYPVFAQAISDSILIFYPKNEFKQLLMCNSTICFNMLTGFAKRMRRLTQKVEDLTTKEVSSRFSRYLLEEITKAGTDKLPEPFVKLNISKKNIASYIGTITETLSRLLKKLQDDGIIRIVGKTVFVSNLPKLKSIAN
jgi:CRP/FNR family transcriptional regulator